MASTESGLQINFVSVYLILMRQKAIDHQGGVASLTLLCRHKPNMASITSSIDLLGHTCTTWLLIPATDGDTSAMWRVTHQPGYRHVRACVRVDMYELKSVIRYLSHVCYNSGTSLQGHRGHSFFNWTLARIPSHIQTCTKLPLK